MDASETVAHYERQAEIAYAAMYEARTARVKDLYEEAREHLRSAIAAARFADLDDEALRLARRLEHVEQVYRHQFRGVG